MRAAQAIQTLKVGQACIRLPDDSVHRVATPTLPTVAVSSEQLTAVRESYLRRYFRPMPRLDPASAWAAAASCAVSPTPIAAAKPPPIRRHHPDEPADPPPAPAAAGSGTVFAPGRDRNR